MFLVDALRFVRSSEIAKFLPSEKFMQEAAAQAFQNVEVHENPLIRHIPDEEAHTPRETQNLLQ